MNVVSLLVTLCACALSIGLQGCLNHNDKPDYIEDILTRRRGPHSIKTYIILANTDGKQVNCSGRLSIQMSGYSDIGTPILLYDTTYSINKSDFGRSSMVKKGASTLFYSTTYLRTRDFKNHDKLGSSKLFISVRLRPDGSTKEIKGNKFFN